MSCKSIPQRGILPSGDVGFSQSNDLKVPPILIKEPDGFGAPGGDVREENPRNLLPLHILPRACPSAAQDAVLISDVAFRVGLHGGFEVATLANILAVPEVTATFALALAAFARSVLFTSLLHRTRGKRGHETSRFR